MADYIKAMQNSLMLVTGQAIEVLDFDDDRLTHLLRHLSQETICEQIERDLSQNCVEVYELKTEIVRCDTTTVSGYHQLEEKRVM